MFPCSSNYQYFPRTNQTWRIDHDDNTFDDHDQNSLMISSNYEYHHQQEQHFSPPYYLHNVVPSIFEDDGVILSHLLSQQQLLAGNMIVNTSHEHSQAQTDEISVVASKQLAVPDPDHDNHNHDPSAEPMKGPSSSKKQRAAKQTAGVPRKRMAGKKDRHSKICTAQGIRDRRMRLSLQIARKFFDLQDMLGFDKASRTIEWLFTKSKAAIKELKDSLVPKQQLSSSNSTSEGEAVSRTIAKTGTGKEGGGDQSFSVSMPNKVMKKIRKLQKVVTRESRDKARARARERTREKMLEKSRQSTTTTASEAENHSTTVDLGNSRANVSTTDSLELKGEEEMTCHSDLKLVAPRFDQAEPSNQLQLDYSSMSQDGHVGVSIHSRANSQEDFLGFPQNWGNISCSSKTQSFCPKNMGNNVVRVHNPYAILTANSGDHFFSTQEQKPSSIKVPTSSNAQKAQIPSRVFMSTTRSSAPNPSSSLMATSRSDAEERNPSPIFMTTSNVPERQVQNPISDFLANSNTFCSLNF